MINDLTSLQDSCVYYPCTHARTDEVLAVDSRALLDVFGSMDGVSSTDAVEVLRASLAAEPAAGSEVDAEKGGRVLGMSTAVQGMILLNISAALFGSNQVRCRH